MVPVNTGAEDGALALFGAVGDALAGRRLGFSRRRADAAARFAQYRGANDEATDASWIAGLLAEAGLLEVVLAPSATERQRLFALSDAPLHGAHVMASLDLPAHAADIVRWHREHDDGTGYPDRLRWDGIPADAAALGIVHAACELVEDPVEPRPIAEALFAIVAESGRRFSVERVRAFRAFVAARGDSWDEPFVPALSRVDENAVLSLLATRIDARDDRTLGRSERVALLAAGIAERLQIDAATAARLVRLHALGRATASGDDEDFDPLSRFGRERRAAEAERAAALAAVAPRYAADAPLLVASARWHEEGESDVQAATLALALAVEALDAVEAPRRIAAAAGTQFDPHVARTYLASLGAPT